MCALTLINFIVFSGFAVNIVVYTHLCSIHVVYVSWQQITFDLLSIEWKYRAKLLMLYFIFRFIIPSTTTIRKTTTTTT